MQQKKYTIIREGFALIHERPRHLKKQHQTIGRGLLLFCGLLLALISMLSSTLSGTVYARAGEAPGGNITDPRIRNVDLALPSVVRIFTAINGQLKAHISSTDVTFPQQNSQTYTLRVTGTGTFISAHGDILTADHVVKPATDKDLTTSLYQAASTDIANYLNSNATQGQTQTTPQAVDQQLTSGQLQSSATFGAPTSTIYLSTAYTGKTNTTNTSILPSGIAYNVDKIEQESPPDQADTAIIHVPLNDSLSVPIGNSSEVQPQDQLTTIGFPGNSDIGNSPDSLLTSSVNQVFVNAQKTGQKGNPLIQITGNVSPGDSGGPALGSQGNIMGIVSFGVVAQTGTNNTSFLQASSTAQSMIKALKLDTTPGAQEKLWSQAFASYASTTPGHWHTAEQQFAQLLQQYPTFKQVQLYYDYAQTQARNELVPVGTTHKPSSNNQRVASSASTLFNWQSLALLIGSAVLVVLLAVGMLGTAVRQKKKPLRNNNDKDLRTAHGEGGKETIVDEAPSRPVGTSATASTTLPPGTPLPNNQSTMSLKIWPCGHMNRSNARFCSTCGEPAP